MWMEGSKDRYMFEWVETERTKKWEAPENRMDIV